MTTLRALENQARRTFLEEVQAEAKLKFGKRCIETRFFGCTEPLLHFRCVTDSDIEYVFVIALTTRNHEQTEVSIAQYDYRGTSLIHDYTGTHLTAALHPSDVAARLASICLY